MKNLIKSAVLLAGLVPAIAAAQSQPNLANLPAGTVVGRLLIGPGPTQAIPFSVLVSQLQLASKVVSGPSSSAVGNFALWSNILGTSISDGGTPGTLAFVNGGTGVNAALAASLNATGGLVGFNGALGTPLSGTLTNATGLPISTGVSGLGTGCASFLGTPSSANLRGCLTDEAGTGAAYFVGGALGTPASATLTNAAGLPVSGLAAQSAFSFVGNNTSGSASPTAVSIASLTSKASPVAGDLVMIADSAASNAWKQTTVSALASAGSVSSIAGNTGAFTLSHGLTNSANDIQTVLSAAQTFLGSDVLLNNTANYFDVVNTGSIGASGQTWLIMANFYATSGSSASQIGRIWDGTTVYTESGWSISSANNEVTVHLTAVVTLSAATTFKLSCKDRSVTTGKVLTTGNAGTANKATSITAIRLL